MKCVIVLCVNVWYCFHMEMHIILHEYLHVACSICWLMNEDCRYFLPLQLHFGMCYHLCKASYIAYIHTYIHTYIYESVINAGLINAVVL
jgi:hypothetical protein